MYEIVELYSDAEIKVIKTIIQNVVREATGNPKLILERYHLDIEEEEHCKMGQKRLRVLDEGDTVIIGNLKGTKRLLHDYPNYRVGEVVYNSSEREDRPQFYFRLVRPQANQDVGLPHCDFWFDEATGTGYGLGNTIKLWIPIVIEPGLNGLYFYPDAPRHVPFKIIKKGGFRRPIIDLPVANLGTPVLPRLTAGYALRFRDDVLHAGAPNRGQTTRVSMEITLVRNRV